MNKTFCNLRRGVYRRRRQSPDARGPHAVTSDPYNGAVDSSTDSDGTYAPSGVAGLAPGVDRDGNRNLLGTWAREKVKGHAKPRLEPDCLGGGPNLPPVLCGLQQGPALPCASVSSPARRGE